MEIWKEIKDYPNYMVSNLGRVKSLNYNRTGVEQIRKLKKNDKGYLSINLSKNNNVKWFFVHRLEAIAFDLPIPEHLKNIPIEKIVNKLQHMVLSGNIQKRQDIQNWKRIKKKKRQHPLKKTAIKQYI